MSAFRIWLSGLGLVLLVLAGEPVRADKPTGTKPHRVILYPEAGDTVEQLQRAGLTKIEKCGAYWLAEATDSQLEVLRKSHKGRVEDADRFTKLQVGGYAIDTTVGEPNLPQNLRSLGRAGQRLWVVQFKGPVLPEWLTEVQRTAGVKVLQYVPQNAYVVQADANMPQRLRGLMAPAGAIQWIGAYHPAYKAPQALLNRREIVRVNVGLINDADGAVAVEAVKRYAVNGVRSRVNAQGQMVVDLRVSGADVAALAQIESVMWVDEVRPTKAMDELQALVMTRTNAPGSSPVPLWTDNSYVSWLAARGFPTPYDSSYGSMCVLDITDTGLDSVGQSACESCYPWHPAFWFPAAPVDAVASPCTYTAPPYVNRVAYSFLQDTDPAEIGHGTFVASIAAGFDTLGDELTDCFAENHGSNCVTDISNAQVCVTNGFTVGFESCVGPVPPACCFTPTGCTNWNITCTVVITTNITCTPTCDPVTNNAICAAPPYGLYRQDFSGYQLSLGVSPYGRIGASSFHEAASDPESVAGAAYLNGARVSNNSWGEVLSVQENDGLYGVRSAAYDSITRDALVTGSTNMPGINPVNQEMLFVFAGGNDNGIAPVGYGDVLTTPPATAKNVISVGATDLGTIFHTLSPSWEVVSTYSSFGPCRDGRFKPDVVAPGTFVTGATSQGIYEHPECGTGVLAGDCNPNNGGDYTCQDPSVFGPTAIISRLHNTIDCDAENSACCIQPFRLLSGTSFSAPAVSGGAQLLWWWFQNRPVDYNGAMLAPSPAMMKAYIMNSASYVPITNPFTGSQDTLPSIAQGMGMMSLSRMFDLVPRVLRDQSTPRAFDVGILLTNPVVQQTYFTRPGQSYELSGTVASNGLPFRVTLGWTDAPGAPQAINSTAPSLVNDLDLQVIIGDQVYYGNVFVGPNSVDSTIAMARNTYDRLNNIESVFLPSLPAGTPWKVLVRAVNIAGTAVPHMAGAGLNQDFSLTVYNATNPSDQPDSTTNDTCQTAVNIMTLPYVWTNNLTAATGYHNNHPSPAVTRGGIEEFFRIPRPSPNTQISVNTYGSDFDTVLSVWKGNCGALNEQISDNDSNGGLQSAATFVTDGTNDYYIVVDTHSGGSGGRLVLNVSSSVSPVTVTPSSLLFADQVSGTTSAWQTVTLQNGLSVPLNVGSVTLAGADASQFVIVSDNCSSSLLLTNSSCPILVAFKPTGSSGPRSAQLVITDDATGSPRIVPLSGTALGPAPLVCLDSNHLFFEAQLIGTTGTQTNTVTLTNCGTDDLILSNRLISGPAASDFVLVVATCDPLPQTVGPGGSCTFGLVFAPTSNGNRNAVWSFTDNATDSPQTVLLTGKGCATITLAALGQPTAEASTPYSQFITASGGISPYTYEVSVGGLPPGLTLAGSGLLSGTPTLLGSYNFTVTATDATGCTGTRAYTLTVGCPTIVLQPVSLPDGLQGTTYSNQFTTSTGILPVTFARTAGGLPAGLTLSANGILTGTLTAPGSYQFTITATDSNACTGSQTYTVNVTPTSPLIGFDPALLPTFGDIVVGATSSVKSVTVTNAGTGALTITNVVLAGSQAGDFLLDPANTCVGTPVAAGGTCLIRVRFKPTDIGNRSADVMVYDNADGNPHSFQVKGRGIGPVMTVQPTCLDFGTQMVATASAPLVVQVFNTGNGPLQVTGVSLISTNAGDFTIVNNDCLTAPIQPGSSCTISISYRPGATLPSTGTLVLTGDGINGTQTVCLRGVGAVPPNAPLIVATPNSLNFGTQLVGTGSSNLTVYVNNLGNTALHVTGAELGGLNPGDFVITSNSCSTVLPGGLCSMKVQFAPQVTVPRNALLLINSDATNGQQQVALSGTGIAPVPRLQLSVTNLNFGIVTNVAQVQRNITLSNTGVGPLLLGTLSIVGSSNFSITNDACSGGLLNPGASCNLSLLFKPGSDGDSTASLVIPSNLADSPTNIALSGSRVSLPAICFAPTPVDFGLVTVGQSSNQTLTVTNCGITSLDVYYLALSAGDFSITSNSCLATFPTTIPVGGACTIGIGFTPTSNGLQNASLTFVDSVAGSPQVVTLKGTGTSGKPDALIARKDNAKFYIGNDIYNTTGDLQEVAQRGRQGKVRHYYVALQNDGNATDRFKIQGPASLPGFATVRYYLGANLKDSLDITDAVVNGTYLTANLAAGATTGDATLIRVDVTVEPSATAGTQSLLVTVTSASNGTKQDAAKVTVTVK